MSAHRARTGPIEERITPMGTGLRRAFSLVSGIFCSRSFLEEAAPLFDASDHWIAGRLAGAASIHACGARAQ